MRGETVNGELAAENIADLLDAHERALMWKEDDGGGEREELIRSADHYSPLGTDILRRHHGSANAFVIDDGERHRYVVARRVLDAPEPSPRRRRFRRWIGDAPIRLYGQWRTTGKGLSSLLPSNWIETSYRSADGTRIVHERKGKLEVGGWSEFSSWLRAFPWLRYREKPLV